MILKPKMKKVNKLKRVSPRRLDKCYTGLTEMITLAEKCYKGEHLELRGNTPNQILVELKWYMCYLYSLELNNTPLDNLELVIDILNNNIGKDLLEDVSGISCTRDQRYLVILLYGKSFNPYLSVNYNTDMEEINVYI